MSNFHPLAVVGRGSVTRLQMGKNLNYLFQRFKSYASNCIIMLEMLKNN